MPATRRHLRLRSSSISWPGPRDVKGGWSDVWIRLRNRCCRCSGGQRKRATCRRRTCSNVSPALPRRLRCARAARTRSLPAARRRRLRRPGSTPASCVVVPRPRTRPPSPPSYVVVRPWWSTRNARVRSRTPASRHPSRGRLPPANPKRRPEPSSGERLRPHRKRHRLHRSTRHGPMLHEPMLQGPTPHGPIRPGPTPQARPAPKLRGRSTPVPPSRAVRPSRAGPTNRAVLPSLPGRRPSRAAPPSLHGKRPNPHGARPHLPSVHRRRPPGSRPPRPHRSVVPKLPRSAVPRRRRTAVPTVVRTVAPMPVRTVVPTPDRIAVPTLASATRARRPVVAKCPPAGTTGASPRPSVPTAPSGPLRTARPRTRKLPGRARCRSRRASSVSEAPSSARPRATTPRIRKPSVASRKLPAQPPIRPTTGGPVAPVAVRFTHLRRPSVPRRPSSVPRTRARAVPLAVVAVVRSSG